MTGRERLIIGTKWMLENVRQEQIEMGHYWGSCNSCGCWLGWISHCPALNDEGLAPKQFAGLFVVHGEFNHDGYEGEPIRKFFNLSMNQSIFLFARWHSGGKRNILARLHTVLLQPGPFDEPEMAKFDAEWAALQQALEGVTT